MVRRPSGVRRRPSSSSVVVHTFKLEYLWSQLANLDQILCVALLGRGKGCIRFWGRLDQNSGFHGNRKPPFTYNGENDVSTFSRLFLIRSFLYFQVTRTCIKSRMSSNFGQFGRLTTELAALERLKNFPYTMGKWCHHASSFIFNRIVITVAGNQDRHKSTDEFDFGPDQTTNFGVTCPWMMKILHFRTWISLRPVGQSWSNFMCSITGGGERLHNVLRQIGSKLWCPWQQKVPIDLLWGKWCLHLLSVAIDPILFVFAGIEDMHKISDVFEFRPDRTTELAALELLKNSPYTYNGKIVSPC